MFAELGYEDARQREHERLEHKSHSYAEKRRRFACVWNHDDPIETCKCAICNVKRAQ